MGGKRNEAIFALYLLVLVLCCVALCCVVLCYVVLCCVVLCLVVSCCSSVPFCLYLPRPIAQQEPQTVLEKEEKVIITVAMAPALSCIDCNSQAGGQLDRTASPEETSPKAGTIIGGAHHLWAYCLWKSTRLSTVVCGQRGGGGTGLHNDQQHLTV